MNLSQIHKETILKGQPLKVDKQTIFILFPDTKINMYKELEKLNILLSNCNGFIVPNRKFRIDRVTIDGRIHYYDVKKTYTSMKGRKIRILNSVPRRKGIQIKKKTPFTVKKNNSFIFYDASVWIKAYEITTKRLGKKMATVMFIEEWAQLYRKLKTPNPVIEICPIFVMNSAESTLKNLLEYGKQLFSNKYKNEQLFDNIVLFNSLNSFSLPILVKSRAENVFLLNNANKFISFIDSLQIKTEIENSVPPVDKEKENLTLKEKVISNPITQGIVNKLSTTKKIVSKIDPDSAQITEYQLNKTELRRILRKHKITDPDLIITVKSALDQYLNTHDEQISKDEAELIVLKAVNYFVHGTDEIPDKYLSNPQLLFNKLHQTDVYKKKLNIPELPEYTIFPKDIIDINYTTGQHRQEYEFKESIHKNMKKLFSTLENTINYPVKVKKIKHDVIDDNNNRLIQYTVTLQNVDTKLEYDVKLNVPAIVNEKYFKLGGNLYVMSSQHFLKPITKTEKSKVRLLTNYAPITIEIKNLKFEPSDLPSLIEYVNIRYPNIIKSYSENQIKFSDGTAININSDNLYMIGNKTIVRWDTDKNSYVNVSTGERINKGKYEFIFEKVREKVQAVNPKEKFTRNVKSIPYFQVYLMGIQLPLIYYLWQQKGLLTALNNNGIDYEITDNPKGSIIIPTKDNQYLVVKPEGIKQELLANGLLAHNIKEPIINLDDKEAINDLLLQHYGSRSVYYMNLVTENEIDPITKELLEFENLPTNLPALLSGPCIDKLLNQKPDSLADLKIYRSRLSEMILNLMYSQIKQAHNHYVSKRGFGQDDAKIIFDPDYIINNILETGVLQNTMSTNPIEEIMLASQVIKTGKGVGGVPTLRAIKPEHRNIHPSQLGIMSANATPEYQRVGVTVHHTLTPTIINEYGSYGVKTDIDNISGWNNLAMSEALVPFQNQMDSDRLVLAVTHLKQITPISNVEEPLVRTGGEYIVPQLTSSRFVQRAKKDGVITKVVPDKYIVIKYKDGTEDVLDIIPRRSRTKRGAFIELKMNTLEEGTKVKANQVVAYTNNFSKNGVFCSGKNVVVAMIDYMGLCHEDQYLISKKLADETTVDIIEQKSIIIPPKTKVLQLEKEKKELNGGETLVEFTYEADLESYIDAMDFIDNDEGDIAEDLGQTENTIKLLAPKGEIVDIKVFINNRVNMDKSVLQFHKELSEETKKLIAILSKNKKNSDDKISAIDNLDLKFLEIGGHKGKNHEEFRGAMITYYIKTKKKENKGDKLSNRYGAKGVAMLHDKEIKSKETGLTVDLCISPIGVFSRKNLAMLKEIYIGKIFYFLNKKAKEFAASKSTKIQDLSKVVLDIYKTLCSDNAYKSVEKKLNSYKTASKLKKDILNGKLQFYFVVEPFNNKADFKNIKIAAEILDIPLEEHVYIPELDMWTKEPVPVGIGYYQFLEHFSNVYSSVRGTERYTGLTRQPTKGKSKLGGQKIGHSDLYALLTHEVPDVINELYTLRSDDHKAKQQVYNSIIQYGEAKLPKKTGGGGTLDLMETYMTAMGLEMS